MITEKPLSPERFPIEQLLQTSAFPHSVSRLRVLETHISWIVLTGDFAYKIKKPVKLDFVDYSSLDKRRLHCQNEVELNRRYSEGVYLDVVPIYNFDGHYRVGNPDDRSESVDESPIEFAVKMREFDQDCILALQLKQSKLSSQMLEQFAKTVAGFHQSEPAVFVDIPAEELEKIHGEVLDNFDTLRRSLAKTPQEEPLERIADWSEQQFQQLKPQITERIEQGFLKKCHGDLHLNNIIYHHGKLVPFDGIEFNEHLQTIDTFNEIAFLFMDLMAHGHEPHAWRFLSTYLEFDRSYDHLNLFRFFTVYRAMVRAKVAWMNCQVRSSTSGHQSSWLKGDLPPSDELHREPVHPWDHYLEFAEKTISHSTPRLSITFGFSGSGKSVRAKEEVERGAICLRSDIKRMQMKEQQKQGSFDLPLYSKEASDQIYHQMLSDAESILQSGYSVVVDATFLNREYRDLFYGLADKMGIPLRIFACDASFIELCSRIRNRTGDPSEATIEVLQKQMEEFDPLDPQEQCLVVAQDPSNPADAELA